MIGVHETDMERVQGRQHCPLDFVSVHHVVQHPGEVVKIHRGVHQVQLEIDFDWRVDAFLQPPGEGQQREGVDLRKVSSRIEKIAPLTQPSQSSGGQRGGGLRNLGESCLDRADRGVMEIQRPCPGQEMFSGTSRPGESFAPSATKASIASFSADKTSAVGSIPADASAPAGSETRLRRKFMSVIARSCRVWKSGIGNPLSLEYFSQTIATDPD
jgi:hypothetical protein